MILQSVEAKNLKKKFARRVIFENISFKVERTQSVAIVGKNGSGKSTLAKIIAGVLSPTSGSFSIQSDSGTIPPEDWNSRLGFVSPYLQLYDEFTAWEHLVLFSKIRGISIDTEYFQSLLKMVGLLERKDHDVRIYSSGMKQRLKYACALSHRPEILILDEPTSNLDEEGISMIYEVMRNHLAGGILILATNDRQDAEMCQLRVDLNPPVKPFGGSLR